MSETSRARVITVWILTCLIWSTVWLFIKLGVRDVPPVSFAAMRLLIGIMVMLPVTLALKVPLPKRPRDWGLIAGTGIILLGFNYALLNWGIRFISSGLTAVLQAITPAFALVFSHFLLQDERMTTRKVAGLALGVVGIAAIFWDQLNFGGRALAGSVTVTLGAVCVAFAYVMIRRSGTSLHPSAITTGQMMAAFVPLLAYGWAVEGNPVGLHWTSTALVSATYLALMGSVVAAWLNYWLLQRVGAVNLLIMGLVEPPIAVALGAWLLGETMNARAIAGSALILVSVWLAMGKPRR
ncbi:MAG: DMT family transporter [Acidobacteria bacterium]|nr:DMT family transporter [Acidobacteriota bacterium]